MRAKLEKSYKIFIDFQEEHVGKVVLEEFKSQEWMGLFFKL